MSNNSGDYTEPPGPDPRLMGVSRGRGAPVELGDHRVLPLVGGRGRGMPTIGQERRELRRPMEVPPGMISQDAVTHEQNNIPIVSAATTNMDVLQRSKLNACAQEFVPSWLQQNPVPDPVAETHSKDFLSGNDSEFGLPVSAAFVSERSFIEEVDDPIGYTTCHIEHTIVQMTVNPGEFDSLAMPLVRFLNENITNENMLKEVVNTIFEQSVTEANFRYNGARLCNILSHNLSLHIPEGNANFRNLLLQRCNKENQNVNNNLIDKQSRVFGFAYFLGELYSNLEITKDGKSHRITVLAKALPKILTVILRQHSNDSVKCACQVMKFTGASLEDEGTLAQDWEQLEEALRCASESEVVAPHLRQMACKVMEMKACNWGRGNAPPVQQPPAPTLNQQSQLITQFQNANINDDPVFYGPDGQALTEEENQFIAEQLAYLEEDENSENWSTADGEMDEEMMRDYAQFLKDQEK